ncbi:MAG: hypothetical protein RLZZ450_136 [Pseudomonadota bacterium]|jgi:hypothetical protein
MAHATPNGDPFYVDNPGRCCQFVDSNGGGEADGYFYVRDGGGQARLVALGGNYVPTNGGFVQSELLLASKDYITSFPLQCWVLS